MNKLESLAKKSLEKNYESVHKLGPKADYFGSVIRKIDEEIDLPDNAILPGKPDFFAWDKDSKPKFVEVKSQGDSLRKRQLEWISKVDTNINIEIWWESDGSTMFEKQVFTSKPKLEPAEITRKTDSDKEEA